MIQKEMSSPTSWQTEESKSEYALEKLEFLMTQIFKEHIHIVGKNNQKIKKLTFYDLPNSEQFVEFIDSSQFELYGCWICELTFRSPLEHLESKDHWRTREELTNLSESDDYSYSIIKLKSIPGDISEEL